MSEETRLRILDKIRKEQGCTPGDHPWEYDIKTQFAEYTQERKDRVLAIQHMLCRTEPQRYYTLEDAFPAAYGVERKEFSLNQNLEDAA